jgi:hypothetical protein
MVRVSPTASDRAILSSGALDGDMCMHYAISSAVYLAEVGVIRGNVSTVKES